MSWYKEHQIKGISGVLVYLYVQPGASQTGVKGVHGEAPPRLKLAVRSPPVDGAANQAVIDWLCETLTISQSKIFILSGEHARQKNIWIEGMTSALLLSSLT